MTLSRNAYVLTLGPDGVETSDESGEICGEGRETSEESIGYG